MITKNLKIKKKNKKLDYIKVELFSTKTKNWEVSYKLKLSKDAKINSIFYLSLFEIANKKTQI